MKELSIEQKAKAYDKALERVKDFIEKQNPPAFDKDLIGTIFPELVESEDEKIRKELIKEINGLWENDSATWPSSLEKKNKYIAWLEKQGEQKPQRMISAEAKEAMYDKPADSYCQENCKGFQETGKCFADGNCKAKREAEQKPAWSEEDEKRLQSCLKILQAKGLMGVTETINTKWLKSLKDRYIWEPSDLQMECLSDAIKHYNSLGYPASKLQELLDDLKNLKGE